MSLTIAASNGVFVQTENSKRQSPPETITVSRGFAYVAVKRKIHLREGERVELAFELHRRANLRRLGWYCGDNHVHMIHGELLDHAPLFVSNLV